MQFYEGSHTCSVTTKTKSDAILLSCFIALTPEYACAIFAL